VTTQQVLRPGPIGSVYRTGRDAQKARVSTCDAAFAAEPADPFEQRLVREERAAYSLAYRYLRSREAAEDVVQEAYIRALRARESFQGEHIKPWLLQIVANCAIDEMRRQKRRPQLAFLRRPSHEFEDELTFEVADTDPGPAELFEQSELSAFLEAALGRLPEPFRMVVLLFDVHGLSGQEVADALGIEPGTVKSRLSRGRARLRDLLLASGRMEELGLRGYAPRPGTGSGSDQPELECARGRLGAVANLELCEDVLDVRLHGVD